MIQKTARSRNRSVSIEAGNDRIDSILLRLDDQRANMGKSCLVFGVVGSDRTSGVSTVAGRLAVRAAEMKLGPVLLVDGNLEHPRQHKNFNVPMGNGIRDVLFNDVDLSEAAQQTSVAGLSVLTAGEADTRAINPDVANAAIREMKLDYPVVILDLPPIRNTSRSFILSKLCDGMVLVLDAQTTGAKQVGRVMQLLKEWDVEVLGSILNRAKRTLPRWIDRWL